MRSRALSRVTESAARPLLFCSCPQLPNRSEILRIFSNGDRHADAAGSSHVRSGRYLGRRVNGNGRGGGHRYEYGVSLTPAAPITSSLSSPLERGQEKGQELEREGRREEGESNIMVMRGQRWLLTLAQLMARPREFKQRHETVIRAFTPHKFRQEWELFWELWDPIADAFETTTAVRRRGGGSVETGRGGGK